MGSILEVARRAGVSKSTVSRVLNGGSVSEKARVAVQRAIEELDYHPNGIARVLRGAKSGVIGVACNSVNALMNPSLTLRFAGINSVLEQQGYSLLLVSINTGESDSNLDKALRFLDEQRIDGLIILGDVDDEKERRRLLQYRQVVYTGERILPDKGFRIYMGNYNYSRDMYAYLFGCGHRKVLSMMVNNASRRMHRARIEAYASVCQQYDVPCQADMVFRMVDTQDTTRQKLQAAYDAFCSTGATAIFVDSTEFANSLITFFSGYGLEVVRDYSLAAVERGKLKGQGDPFITSICLPDFEYGVSCARLMLEVLEDETVEYRDVTVPYQLKVRFSVRNIQPAPDSPLQA